MSIKTYRRILMIAIIIFLIGGAIYYFQWKQIYDSQVAVSDIDTDVVIPGGMPVGIYLKTEGVMVIDTEKIENKDGTYVEPAKNLLKPGDYIVAVNNQKVDSTSKIIEILQNSSNNNVFLKVRRKMEYIDIDVHTVKDKKGDDKIGVWIKDDAQGLGTVTFLTTNSEFGALGHGIVDVNTGEIIDISEGTLYETNIQNVVKGKSGFPGGLEGVIIYNKFNVTGKISKNNETGIYGTIDNVDRVFEEQDTVSIGKQTDIKKGKAVIRCAVEGEVEEYEIEIKKVDLHPKVINKGIEIKVTDQKLLELTGGIVQGMSGSPILQDGKLIGAVTHVFVQDSTRGYGITIENMMKNVGQ